MPSPIRPTQRPPTTAKRAKTSDSKLVDQKKSKRKSMTKRKGQKQHHPPRLTATQRRAEKLQAALAARGLELRSDSRLCREYIGRGGFDLEFVVCSTMHVSLHELRGRAPQLVVVATTV